MEGTGQGFPEEPVLPSVPTRLPVQPTSPAPSPWKPAADFLLVGGKGGEGEGRTGSPLLTPPPHSEARPPPRPPS